MDVVPLKEYFEALRTADQTALDIKEREREKALELSRQAQLYRDEQANKLREQINSERGLYATKEELKPIITYIAGQQGRSGGLTASWGIFVGVLGLAGTIIGILGTLIGGIVTVVYFVMKKG